MDLMLGVVRKGAKHCAAQGEAPSLHWTFFSAGDGQQGLAYSLVKCSPSGPHA